MASSVSTPQRDLAYYARKYVVAALVLASFLGYALHDRQAYASGAEAAAVIRPTAAAAATVSLPPTPAPTRIVVTPSAALGPPTPGRADLLTDWEEVSVRDVLVGDLVRVEARELTGFGRPSPSGEYEGQNGAYKDGTYPGPIAKTVFGPVQVQAVIQGGRIIDVQFLDYPRARRTSVSINSVANPRLQQEAIQIQSAQVHLISGATITARAFIESLRGALNNARP